LPPVFVEVCPQAAPLMGYKMTDIAAYMERFGYVAYQPGGKRRIRIDLLHGTSNVLFLPKRLCP